METGLTTPLNLEPAAVLLVSILMLSLLVWLGHAVNSFLFFTRQGALVRTQPRPPIKSIADEPRHPPIEFPNDYLSHSFANKRRVPMACFRKRGPYPWQAQARKKGHPLQTKTFVSPLLGDLRNDQTVKNPPTDKVKRVSY